ncbi:MAG: hypothetical protein QXN37_04045 [Candidatus Anstonellaceae archaeon]
MELVAQIKEFLIDPFNRYLVAALLILGLVLLLFPQQEQVAAEKDENFRIYYFYLPTCPHCAQQKIFNQKLMEEFSEIEFVSYDASTPYGASLLKNKTAQYGLDTKNLQVPATFFGNWSFIGYESEETTGKKIKEALMQYLQQTSSTAPPEVSVEKTLEVELPLIGKIDPRKYSLPLLAIVLGLVDGFNPCAMWVLVYLIALVMNLNDRTKIWIIVGSFVAASGILYFLFMTAWLNAFLLVGYIRPLTIAIGLIALGGGILSVREYIKTKGEIVCKVGDPNQKKSLIKKMEEVVASPTNLATILGIIALAFVVNSIEFVCSSAIPAVFTQVLALSNLSFWEYYAYIALYDFFFMLDDLIVFGLAAFAVSGEIGQRYAKYCKIVGGVLLLILGLVLLFAPNLLR